MGPWPLAFGCKEFFTLLMFGSSSVTHCMILFAMATAWETKGSVSEVGGSVRLISGHVSGFALSGAGSGFESAGSGFESAGGGRLTSTRSPELGVGSGWRAWRGYGRSLERMQVLNLHTTYLPKKFN
jgi:hypothetical protein